MIEDFKPGDEAVLSLMIRRAFEIYIAPDYSDEGLRTFREFTEPDAILRRFQNGDVILCYREEGRIVGVLDVREGNHICQFFVEPDCHGKGIGRTLMSELVRRLEGQFDSITVNASLYAVKIYEKLRFRATGGKEEKDGIVYIPMKRILNQS